MDSVAVAYLAVFLAGFSFLLLTFLFGAAGAAAEHGDVGHDVGGSADAGGADHSMSPGVFSFRVIACFLVGFGMASLISHYWISAGFQPFAKFPLDLTLGMVGGIGVGWIGWRIIRFFMSQQGGSDVRSADFVGIVAPLTVGIPVGGVGEIAFTFANKRMSLDVRSDGGAAIHTGTKVIVVSMAGSVGVVQKA